jgi:hypothetical protein
MLPNFFVIGAPRSGTTSAYEYLRTHPDVFMSPVKEPDFFADPSLDDIHPIGAFASGSLAADVQANTTAAQAFEQYLALFTGSDSYARRGEASAVYLGHPTAAWHIRDYLPDAKLIVLLRDPAERAYSHFVHAQRIYAEHGQRSAVGADGRSVEEAFARAVEAAHINGMPDPATSDPEVWVRSGFYFAHLTRWRKLFALEQMTILRFEEFAEDSNAVMRRVFEFLGIDEFFVVPTTEAFNASVVPRSRRIFTIFTTRNPLMRYGRSIAPARVRAVAMRTRNQLLGSTKPTLDATLRARLIDIYRDDITSLQHLLGWDLSTWLTP